MTTTAEDKVRGLVHRRGLRVKDAFTDFDRLRRGLVTAAQFERWARGRRQGGVWGLMRGGAGACCRTTGRC